MATSCGTDWPAWIQAIGSVIGIAIAIAVPVGQSVVIARSNAGAKRTTQKANFARLYRLALDVANFAQNIDDRFRGMSGAIEFRIDYSFLTDALARLRQIEAIDVDGTLEIFVADARSLVTTLLGEYGRLNGWKFIAPLDLTRHARTAHDQARFLMEEMDRGRSR